jgi:hypothetical protein
MDRREKTSNASGSDLANEATSHQSTNFDIPWRFS